MFPGGAKSDEISFFLLETKKTIFFAKNVIEKCQISQSRGMTPAPVVHELRGITGVLYDCYGCT